MVTDNEQVNMDASPQPEGEQLAMQEPVAEATEQPVAEPTTPTTEGYGDTGSTETGTEEGQDSGTVNEVDEMRRQLEESNARIVQQEELEAQRLVQQRLAEQQKRLQDQGYMPEQIQQAQQEYAQQLQYSQNLERQSRYNTARLKTARDIARKHKLGVDDLENLERFNTPQDMETEAKRVSQFKKMEAELKALKKQQVPVQKFDTNQPAPSAAGSEDELLDQYNSGVRNSQTEAAARRAAGFG